MVMLKPEEGLALVLADDEVGGPSLVAAPAGWKGVVGGLEPKRLAPPPVVWDSLQEK